MLVRLLVMKGGAVLVEVGTYICFPGAGVLASTNLVAALDTKLVGEVLWSAALALLVRAVGASPLDKVAHFTGAVTAPRAEDVGRDVTLGSLAEPRDETVRSRRIAFHGLFKQPRGDALVVAGDVRVAVEDGGAVDSEEAEHADAAEVARTLQAEDRHGVVDVAGVLGALGGRVLQVGVRGAVDGGVVDLRGCHVYIALGCWLGLDVVRFGELGVRESEGETGRSLLLPSYRELV